jgi:hypothetical protein
MSLTPTQFRTDFPEFANTAIYPDSMVQAWLTVAASLVNATRWAELANIGMELVTAHHLVLGARDQNSAAVGGVPGLMTGPTSAKSVDKVSTSYDTGAASLDGAGFWSLSSYGIRYLTLARMFGAGGLQINGPC